MGGSTNQTGMVHEQTYGDAPLNVRIDTWIFRELPNDGDMNVFIGGIARRDEASNSHFFWYLALTIDPVGNIMGASFVYGYWENGTPTDGGTIDVISVLQDNGLDVWDNHWRWVRIEGFESGGKFHVSIAMTPDISTPDPDNPPENQLIPIASASMNIPDVLKNGGGCGLYIGCTSTASDNSGAEIIDYTQIYY